MGRTRWSSSKTKSAPSPQEPIEVDFEDFECENLLSKPDEETCVFSDTQIESLKRKCCFPEDIDWGELFPPEEDTLAKLEEFFKLPLDKRSPKGLVEAPLAAREDDMASPSVIMSTVSKPVASGSDFDLDDIDAMFGDSPPKIETKPPMIPNKIPAIEDSAGIGSRVRKRKAIQVEVIEVGDVFDGLPLAEIKKKYMSFTTGVMGYLEDLVKENKMIKKKSKSEATLARKKKVLLENKVKEKGNALEKQVKILEEQEKTVKDLLDNLAKSKGDHLKEIDDVRKSCKIAAAKTVIQSKIKMMKDHQDGKSQDWDINKEYAKLAKLTGEPVDEGEVSSSPQEEMVKEGTAVGEETSKATSEAAAI